MDNLSINVIGLGYIGLPTAAMFADQGVDVHGVDINKNLINQVNMAAIDLSEPGLADLVNKSVNNGFLVAGVEPTKADVFIVAVPTPLLHGEKIPDISYVKDAIAKIAPFLEINNLIIVESTCPVGTTEEIARYLSALRPDLTFPQSRNDEAEIMIAYCPERVIPGDVIAEFKWNSRIIGGITDRCSVRAKEIYEMVVSSDCNISDSKTAEMTKLVENSFRDVNLAFANEISIICDNLDVDVDEVIQLANKHPRVNVLRPGAGVGGHCIAVDPWFIVDKDKKNSKLIRCAREVNSFKPKWVSQKILKALNELKNIDPTDKNVAIFGLAFKPNTSDFRGSPAIQILYDLVDSSDYYFNIVEPNFNTLPLSQKRGQLTTMEKAIHHCNVIIFLVAHNEFKSLKFTSIKDKIVLDFCGSLSDRA